MELVEIRPKLTMDRCKEVNGALLCNRQCLLCSSGERAPPAQHHAPRQSHVSPHAQLVWPRPQMTKEPLCQKQLQSVIQKDYIFLLLCSFCCRSDSFQTGNRIWRSHFFFYLVEPQLGAVVRKDIQIKRFTLRDGSVDNNECECIKVVLGNMKINIELLSYSFNGLLFCVLSSYD